MSDDTASQASAATEQQFAIQRIYTKDVSFEAPLGVNAFGQQWKPHINQEISSKNQKLGNDDLFEVVLSLTVTGKLEDKTAFLVEIQQAGLFLIKGVADQQLGHLLNTMCLQILFPYARETIDNLLAKGTFPALMLPPINFDALYAQALAKKSGEQPNSEPTIN